MSAFEYTGSYRRGLSAATGEVRKLAARGIVARVRAILRGMRGEAGSRIATRQLQSLSDWQLKDIGMHRSQIWFLTRGIAARSIRCTHADD